MYSDLVLPISQTPKIMVCICVCVYTVLLLSQGIGDERKGFSSLTRQVPDQPTRLEEISFDEVYPFSSISSQLSVILHSI